MEQSNVLVSVIVPVYNVEKYIDKCIESIINQTYEHLQIILVDDGSTDKSGEICDRYAEKDGRVEVIHKENKGLVSARKAGVIRAKGTYTVNVDGDDWIDSDAIIKYVSIFIKYNPDIIMATSHYNDYETSQDVIRKYHQEGLISYKKYERDIFPYFLEDSDNGRILGYSLCYNIFKTELLKKCQLQVDDNICCGEDGACFLRCIAKSESVYVTNECKYHYLQRIDSTSHKIRKNAENELKLLYINLVEGLRGERYEEALKEKAVRLVHHSIIYSNLNIYWKNNCDILFPFVNVKSNSSIVLYGAGSVGQQMWQALSQGSYNYKVVGWVDQKWEYYISKGYPVSEVRSIMGMRFDYIIITVIDKKISNIIKKNLIELGIPENKIETMDSQVLDEKNIPFRKEIVCLK
jgi:glycosyltransferase involved in cell wall biosynthesis